MKIVDFNKFEKIIKKIDEFFSNNFYEENGKYFVSLEKYEDFLKRNKIDENFICDDIGLVSVYFLPDIFGYVFKVIDERYQKVENILQAREQLFVSQIKIREELDI